MDHWEYQEREAKEQEFMERQEAEAKGHDFHELRRLKHIPCCNALCEDGLVVKWLNGMPRFVKCPACNREEV